MNIHYLPAYLFFLFLINLPIYSAERTVKIAVFDFQVTSQSVLKDEALTLSDYIRSSFVQTGAYDVITRNQLKEILDEYKFQMTGLSEGSNAIRLGNILNVKNAVVGTVGKFGNTYIINIQILNLETGKYLNADSVTADSMDNVFEQVKEKVNSIVNNVLHTEEGRILHVKYKPIIVINNRIVSFDDRLDIQNTSYLGIVTSINKLPNLSPILQSEINNYTSRVVNGTIMCYLGVPLAAMLGPLCLFFYYYQQNEISKNPLKYAHTLHDYDGFGVLGWSFVIAGVSLITVGLVMSIPGPTEVINIFNKEYTQNYSSHEPTNVYNNEINISILFAKISF